MFCPKCGIANLVDQKFCRGCGHALTGHKVVLENNFDDAVEKIKSGSTVLGGSAVTLIVISLMALGVWIFQKDAGAFFILNLAAAATTDPLAHAARLPASITEHTTLNLESPGHASAEASGGSQVDSPSSAS